MKIVISDTSPVRALANLGLLDLLRQLYQEVIIPYAVAVELGQTRNDKPGLSFTDLAELPYVEIRAIPESLELDRFLAELDRGESEALVLAIELRADLILIDELAGRAVAKREGFDVTGVLGVLLEAKHRGMIETISPLLDQLQSQYQFFIGDDLRQHVLRVAGE